MIIPTSQAAPVDTINITKGERQVLTVSLQARGRRRTDMASIKALVANANKLAAANDFSGALAICEQGIQTEGGSKFFPLVSMHGFCAMSLEKYVKAEKSFIAAKLLEANPQMHQKNVKYLAETYSALGQWQQHAEELIHLYRIAKDKGNVERVSSLSSQIATSFEKCQEYNTAGTFLVDHLVYVTSLTGSDQESDVATVQHSRDVLTRLHSLKTAHLAAHEEKKIAKTSIGTQEIVASASIFDQDLLKETSLYPLLLRCLSQLAAEMVPAEEGEVVRQAAPLMSLLLSHLQDRRAEVFRPPAPGSGSSGPGKERKSKAAAATPPPPRVTYCDVFALATEAFAATSAFFPPSSTSSPPCPLACTSFLHICQGVVEAWFFVPEDQAPFHSIAAVVEQGQRVALASSSSSSPIASFLISAKLLHCISTGDKTTAVLLAKQVTPFWVSSIQRHQQLVSNSRKDTMKTPTSSFQLTTAQLQDSSEAVVVTLCLCVAVALGALGGFRGDCFHNQLSLSDSLYLTQEITNRMLCLKKILLALEYANMYGSEDTEVLAESSSSSSSSGSGALSTPPAPFTRGKLRQCLVELVPLGRVRLLLQLRQEGAAFSLCRDQQWLLSAPTSSFTLSAVESERDSQEEGGGEGRQGQGEGLRVNEQQLAGMLPVSCWVLLHSLGGSGGSGGGGGGDRAELARVMGSSAVALAQASSSGREDGASLFASLLQVEKEWMVFLVQLDSSDRKQQDGACAAAELSFTAELLREQGINDSTIAAFTTSLNTIAAEATRTSPYMASYAAEIVQFRIGMALWLGENSSRVDKTQCLAQLVKTAKLNPQFGSVYSFIGHYYLRVLHDTARATKCYIKALAYDPLDAEAGVSLSQIYIEAGEVEKVHKLWSDVNTLTVSHAFWCFSLSGQLNFCLQQYEESIQDFQKSLELRGQDLAAWHSLSVCYSSLGQSVAAFKSLKCALALITSKTPEQQQQWEDMRILLVCDLAEVERRMGSFQDAYDHFDEVRLLTAPSSSASSSSASLSRHQQHIVALKGLGDASLALGYERITCGWTRGACSVVTQGIAAMDAVLELLTAPPTSSSVSGGKGNEGGGDEEDRRVQVLACLLKLKGDLCAFCRYFSPADHATDECLLVQAEARGGGAGGASAGAGAGAGVVVNVRECSYDWVIARVAEAEDSYRKLLTLYQQRQGKQKQGNQQSGGGEEEEEEEGQASVWCDIGSALYHQASLSLAARGQGAGLFSTSHLLSSEHSPPSEGGISAALCLQRAMAAFAQGLLLKPSHSGCWNGAGVCCRLDDSLRELCLVRSTQPVPGENPSPAGYANLGSLFLAHNRQHCAKECLSALQLLESNPLHWLVLGGLLEKDDATVTATTAATTATTSHQLSVFDAYTAALEVSKPVEGLLGSAVAYLQLHGFLSPGGDLVWSNQPAWGLLAPDRVALRYCVEHPISAFLYRRPRHPFAWSLLAWAYVQRQAWLQAGEAYVSVLVVVEYVLSQSGTALSPLPLQEKEEGGHEEEEYYGGNIRRLVAASMRGLELCRRMIPSSSSPSLPVVSCSDFPCIERVSPQFTTAAAAAGEVPTLTKENVIMKAFEEHDFAQCCSLLQTRREEMLGSVQASDVDNPARLRHWVRWMQMIAYFVSHSARGAELESFLGCLVPVGRLLCRQSNKGGEEGEGEDEDGNIDLGVLQQRSYVLNAFRLYPEGFIQVGQALLLLAGRGGGAVAVAVLELGLSLHPRNDAILRMLGRADPSQLQSAAMASLAVTRGMLTASCTEEGEGVDSADVSLSRTSKKKALCCQLVAPVSAVPPPSGTIVAQEQGGTDQSQTPAPSSRGHDHDQGECECECVCPQQRVNRGEAVIPSYCDSVALHSAHMLQTGRRCSPNDRKDLLTALWMDPSNLTTWAALAGSIFSDVALGPSGGGSSSSGEEHGVEEKCEAGGKDMAGSGVKVKRTKEAGGVEGVFSDASLLKTCVEIVLFLRRSCSSGAGEEVCGLFAAGACNSQVADMSLVCDWGAFCSGSIDGGGANWEGFEATNAALVNGSGGGGENSLELKEMLALVSRARNQVFMSNHMESVPLYEQVIRELTASRLSKSFLSKILIELGNVYSFLLLPENACEQYKLSATVAMSQEENPSSFASLASLFCAVAFARKASTSSDHKDATKAREYVDEACEHGITTIPSHVATAHLVKALVWLSLSKPNKVQQEVVEAKALFRSIEAPF